MLVRVSGILAMMGSFVILFGLAKQILLNHNRGRVEGLSTTLIFSAFYTYTTWAVHGWAIHNRYLAITQTVGTVLAAALVVQWFRHWLRMRKNART